jgi:two-component system phosphate regulon sensor histidine kinase PhoR
MSSQKSKSGSIIKSLREILLIIILIILIPTLFYSSLKLFSLDEDEEMISQLYEQQLDVVLFSVNQYIWDFISSWKQDIELNLPGKEMHRGTADRLQMLKDNLSLKYVIVSDSMISNYHVYSLEKFNRTQIEQDLSNIQSPENYIKRLSKYEDAGYRKIESILLRGDEKTGDERMILLSLTNSEQVLIMMVEFRAFIMEIIVPKLQEIATEKMAIAIFTEDTHEAIYQNEIFKFEDSHFTNKLWLFPDYLVGIRTKGKSLNELARDRFNNTLIYNSILLITLLSAVIIIYRNIRKEIRLARMKTDFVSNVSHEFRTPLTLIRMYAETLKTGRVKNEKKRDKYYKVIFEESERLTRLINNILNFARIESGRKEYSFHKTYLNDVIEETVDAYSSLIKSNGFELEVDLTDDLPAILLDVESITECIINLLDNALKYCSSEKFIKVSSGRQPDNIYLEIVDKGIGINKKDLSHIFNKFYRVPSKTVRKTKGSGLGLSLVQHIVQAHSANIDVESIPGEGTTFRILFPTGNNKN